MLFNSLQYAIFLPLVVAAYFLMSHRFRWAFLLLASYFFYMSWKPAYAILLLISTMVDYWAGLRMDACESVNQRRKYLGASLVANLGLLGAFKYFNFLNDSLRALFGLAGWGYSVPELDVLLPVGISFYTFQSLSYSIDVYKGTRKAERHLGIFALYVSFFPQLVAGPIERSTSLMPQLFRKHAFDYERVVSGMRLILWGLFKKMVIADRLAILVDKVYSQPQEFHGAPLWLATYFFAFQIYCDFSGYSDVAIGSARILGFDLMINFRRPYFSRSVAEFWRRWHISLSTWFKDYVYMPLGGNRTTPWRWWRNVMVVFLVSGLWHGAAWTFVIWGGIHGLILICEGFLGQRKAPHLHGLAGRLRDWVGVLLTFHVVLLAWVFFRADSLGSATYILAHLGPADGFWNSLHKLGFTPIELTLSFLLIAFLLLVDTIDGRTPIPEYLGSLPRVARWTLYVAGTLALLHLRPEQPAPFIYFQF